MMAEASKRNKPSLRGLLGNYRYLCKKNMMIRGMASARASKKRQWNSTVADVKRKRTDSHNDSLDTNKLVKITKTNSTEEARQNSFNAESVDVPGPGLFVCKAAEQHGLVDHWEVDSGFSSEASPPASGRSSPCPASCPTTVVAMDCEMVGTGPGGCCSELARCSILDYHGNVLYDKYIRPSRHVTDFRTRWSGIRRHHLRNAVPFAQAREEVLRLLESKVVVGHSIYNDFEALNMLHPGHMVRDTSTTRLLSRLAGFPRERCVSLKILANKLLNRRIQDGKRGHCSVEDAQVALDLYKLVEGEWEQELQNMLRSDDAPREPSFAASNHYMQDEYWPHDLIEDSQ